MRLVIDCREDHLMKALGDLGCEFEKAPLAVGDAALVGENSNVLVIFERKTVGDLAASINDGRYAEQSARLQSSEVPNHNIVYIVEGSIDTYKPRSRISTQALRSAIVSLNYGKGFSVIRSEGINGSAQLLVDYQRKVTKIEESRTSSLPTLQTVETFDSLQTRSKSKLPPALISEAMLSQIPGISTVMAKNILSTVTFPELLESKGDCSVGKSYTTSGGKTRKIPSSVVDALKEYLSSIK